MKNNTLPNKQVASIEPVNSNKVLTSFYTSDVATLGRFGGGFKLKIVKKSPTAEELVNGENKPSKFALAEGYGQAWDIWSEEKDRKRRMW